MMHGDAGPAGGAEAAPKVTRREAVLGAAAALLGPGAASAEGETTMEKTVRFCLNTGTLRGHKLTLREEVEIAAAAGYDGIEPWVSEIAAAQSAGALPDLARRIHDCGLVVEDAIGFAEWVVDDDARRAAGLEQMKRDMELVARLGGARIAAPAAGATDRPVDPRRIAERYRALLELGDRTGVAPQLEVWGFSQTLGTLGEAVGAAVGANHPRAAVLADVFHLYKGGSGFEGLRQLNGAALNIFHMNDYPADPPRERATDANRIFPGDGVAPLRPIIAGLRAQGFRGALSLELFNEDYYRQDAARVARTGLARMKAVAHP